MSGDGDADVGGEDPEKEVDGEIPQVAPPQAGADRIEVMPFRKAPCVFDGGDDLVPESVAQYGTDALVMHQKIADLAGTRG